MGICKSKFFRKKSGTNEQIERDIRVDRDRQRHEVKLLLLGAGESGKSTILKQMKLIHEGGYSVAELNAFKQVIYGNLLASMKALLVGIDRLHWDFANKDTSPEYAKYIRSLPDQLGINDRLEEKTYDAIKALWSDSAIQQTQYKAGNLFYLNEKLAALIHSGGTVDYEEYYNRRVLGFARKADASGIYGFEIPSNF